MNPGSDARPLTPSQTVGPFFHDCLLRSGAHRGALWGDDAPGRRIHVQGCVYDGDGAPVPDAVLELWQADDRGTYHHRADPRWTGEDEVAGYGRVGTDVDGRFSFRSILPGAVPGDSGLHQAPHISIAVFARGLMNHLFTRMYFPDERGNETDAVLLAVPEHRRSTLVARAVTHAHAGGATPREYQFDIVLQGRDETVFLAIA